MILTGPLNAYLFIYLIRNTCAIVAIKYVNKYAFKGPDRVMAKFYDCHICTSLVLLGLPVWSFCVDLVGSVCVC